MTDFKQTGDKGELIAARYLEKQGYSIITMNWHSPYGEIDIIARFKDIYVFVEVKTRHSRNTESAFVSVTSAKRDKLTKSVYLYLDENNLDDEAWRVDVIAIALHKNQAPIIEHVEDALDW